MQEYVSDKLTHFAGRSQPDNAARYDLLALIIRSGTLLDARYIQATKSPLFYFDIREKDGSFTNTQRLLQWHHTAIEPPGEKTTLKAAPGGTGVPLRLAMNHFAVAASYATL